MSARRRKPKPKRPSTTSRIGARHNVVSPENDNLSRGLEDLVPKEFIGTSRYLDVVQWNLEWFGASKSTAKDKKRLHLITDILDTLNGDLFVLQEIAGPSQDGRYPGALDVVAEELKRRGAGDHVVYYTQLGGEQRVAMMWDREWLRSKTEVTDLYKRGEHKTADGKDAFATRSPLYGFFSTRIPDASAPNAGSDKFDFQILGVHLKAMADGHSQRLKSAEVLADWMTNEAPKTDTDVLIMGDWNAPPDDPCWAPIHALEKRAASKVHFTDINDPSDFSYLWLANRSTKYVSHIDLTAMSAASMQQVKGKAAQVVRWKPITDVLARAGSLTDTEVRDVMAQLKESISDHMPTVSRFYFTK